jgi:hypothetical protein
LFRNFLSFHKLEAKSMIAKGLGRGKGFKNIWVNEPIKGNLADYWIKRLKDVIIYLEKKSKNKTKLKIEIPINRFSVVRETYVLPTMESKLSLIPSTTLNVPKPSLVISTKKKEKMSK